MHAFILAGGFATRLWPLTEKRAKPLLPIAGKPIVNHIIDRLPENMPITVSTNAALEKGFDEWKQTMDRGNITILIEEAKSDAQKLGALGAVAQWITQQNIDDDVLLLTGDNYFGFSMEDYLSTYTEGTPLLAAYDIKEKEQAKAFGTIILEKGTKNISAFEEKPAEPKTTIVSTGCSILPKSVLPILLEYAKEHPDNVGGIFEELLRKNQQVECYTFNEPWFDIGSFGAYLEANSALVGNNTMLADTATCTNSTTEGSVVIGENAHVKDSTLTNVILFEDCDIEDCILEDCIVDKNTTLKGVDLTGKMLREHTILEKSN